MLSKGGGSRRLRVDLTGRTVFIVLATAAAVWLWLQLWQWLLLLVVAAFIAVGLDPLVRWLEARGLGRALSATGVVLLLAALVVGFFYFAGAELATQGRLLGERLAQFQSAVLARVPSAVMQFLPRGSDANGQIASYAAGTAQAISTGMLSMGVALVLTVYLLIDGQRTYDWLVAFAPADERPRIRATAIEARRTVMAYVRGNAVTSVIAAVCTYIFLMTFGVPAPLLLSLLTGIFDFIPVLGIFLTAIPVVLLALTVSPAVAGAAIAFILAYHVVENYFISPKVYGSALRLSSLAIILAFGVGAELGGVIGALVALPIAAMYPAVESIWLADRLGVGVAEKHRRIEQTPEP